MKEHSNTTKYFILSELSKKEMHGYELISKLAKITGKRPSTSQVYPVLKQMKAAGYVSVDVKSVGRKKAKHYRLTKSGRNFFLTLNRQFESLVRTALGEKIKVCAHCGCEMIKGAVSETADGKKLYFCCRSCAGAYKK